MCDDDDDLVLLAFEGLKDLAKLGSERFAKTVCFVVKLVHFQSIFLRCNQLNESFPY